MSEWRDAFEALITVREAKPDPACTSEKWNTWHREHEAAKTAFVSSVASLEERNRELEEQLESEIKGVLCIRCMDHRHVPQLNTKEATGAECPICHLETPIASKAEDAETQKAQGMAIELLQETVSNHSDPKSSDYNQCDQGGACCWCEEAKQVIATFSKKASSVPNGLKSDQPSSNPKSADLARIAELEGALRELDKYLSVAKEFGVDVIYDYGLSIIREVTPPPPQEAEVEKEKK